jgi:hypothetical protein
LSVISRFTALPCSAEEGEGSFDEAGHGLGLLVGVELDVGEPRVVVDDRVREVVADPRLGAHPAAAVVRAVTRDPMTGPPEGAQSG